MKSLLELIEAHPVSVAALTAVLPLVFPKVRSWVTWPIRFFQRRWSKPTRVEEKLNLLVKMVMPNGGSSLADSLKRVEESQVRVERRLGRLDAHHRQSFIGQPRPAMEMDGDGNCLLVSGALIRLCHADSENNLTGLSYQQYLDGSRVQEFQEAYERISANAVPSVFSFPVAVLDSARQPRGLWEWRAIPVGARFAGDVLYTASLHPLDALAKEVAERNRWQV